jgi:hypothetical protein
MKLGQQYYLLDDETLEKQYLSIGNVYRVLHNQTSMYSNLTETTGRLLTVGEDFVSRDTDVNRNGYLSYLILDTSKEFSKSTLKICTQDIVDITAKD